MRILAIERLNSITTTQKLEIVKEHMAIAAFSSDAGWYCFSSDEWLSEVAKSPFVRLDGTPFHKEEVVPNAGNAAIENFIQGINSTFLMLRQSPDIFWVEIFYSDDGSHLIFVRHLSEEQLPADIVWVKIKEDAKDCNKDAVTHILSERHAELTSFNGVNFFYLK